MCTSVTTSVSNFVNNYRWGSFRLTVLFFASFTESQLFFIPSGFRFFEIYLHVRLPLPSFRLAVVGCRAICPKCSILYSEYVVCRHSPMFQKNLLLPSSGGTHNRSVLHITAMKYSNPAPIAYYCELLFSCLVCEAGAFPVSVHQRCLAVTLRNRPYYAIYGQGVT